MITSILFDFFGTLVDSFARWTGQGYDNTYRLWQTQDINVGYETCLDHWWAASETFQNWSQMPVREFAMPNAARAFLERVGRDASDDALPCVLRNSPLDEWSKGVAYFEVPGPFLRCLAPSFSLGLVTNIHHASMLWNYIYVTEIGDAFTRVVTFVEVGRPQPHPQLFTHALDRMGASPSKTLFVDDAYQADYLGATEVGMRALLIDPTQAHHIEPVERLRHIFDTAACHSSYP